MKKPAPHLQLVEPPRAATGHPASLAEHTDDDLMRLARAGSRPAFETLVRRHQARVLAVAARRLGHPAFAADVAQNTFLAIYGALASYQARGRFTSFLYQVLLNQCRMHQRAARVEARALGSVAEEPRLLEHDVLAREWQRDVESALARLSDKLRDVVVLRFNGGLGYEEIAETLKVPVGTVKRRLFDGLAKMRDGMERP